MSIDPTLNLWYFPIAVLLGCLHALEPGHAKSLTAAYLIGIKGTVIDAITLGISVAITHSLLVVGLVAVSVYFATPHQDQSAYANQISHRFEVGFAGLIVLIGSYMLWRRWRQYRRAVEHEQAHEHGHDHHHDHGHCHEHGLPPTVAEGQRPSFWQIISFGAAGGLIPCPASIVVMLLAVSAGKAAIGMVIVLGFSIGLALTLVGVGVLVVTGLKQLTKHRHFEKWSARAPLISACVLVASGLFALARTVFQ